MGFAMCRFGEDEGCSETGSTHWRITLPDQQTIIEVPFLWKHYAQDHRVQPTSEEREVVMNADLASATSREVRTRGGGSYREMNILYVERQGPNTYTHEVGEKPDTEFIDKLERLVNV